MAKRGVNTFSDFDQRIQEHLDRAYRRVFGNSPGSPNFCSPYMEPPVDVYETKTHVVVLMEIAGIPEAEIEIEVDGPQMTIRGERRAIEGPPDRAYHQLEIANGPFQRAIRLPAEVNPEQLEAVYKDGILQIAVPKSEPNRGRQLRIVVR
jgi:HSP20 family protein